MAKMMEGMWGGLPGEITERVLSFLSVPALCRFRCVCKRWNALINTASFHDLCDTNKRKANYLFLTRYVIYSDWCYVDPKFIRTLSFLDIASRRWYTIKTHHSFRGYVDPHFGMGLDTRLLAMDDGLLCNLTAKYDTIPGTPIVVFDPVARTRTTLRAPTSCCPTDALPVIVMVAEPRTRSYRVFFVNNCALAETRIFVYESIGNAWRAVRNLSPVSSALSAVFFHDALYVVFQTDAWNKYLVLSLQNDVWTPVMVSVPEKPSHPQLVVSGDRLFLMVWSFSSDVTEVGRYTANSAYEVIEILVAENESKRVVQITSKHLQESFGEDMVDIAYGIPWVDSSGRCCSVTLVSSLSGKMVNYNLATRVVDVLPAHPLENPSLAEVDFDGLPVYASYCGKHMSLSLRDLLSNDMVVTTG